MILVVGTERKYLYRAPQLPVVPIGPHSISMQGRNARLQMAAAVMVMLIRNANFEKNFMMANHSQNPARLVVFAPARMETPRDCNASRVLSTRLSALE